jgi:hypothetical protein
MTNKNQTIHRRVEVPFRVLVVKADPDFEKDKRNEIEYEFTRRKFYALNSNKRGPYDHP